jgi:hypothetical protein
MIWENVWGWQPQETQQKIHRVNFVGQEFGG